MKQQAALNVAHPQVGPFLFTPPLPSHPLHGSLGSLRLMLQSSSWIRMPLRWSSMGSRLVSSASTARSLAFVVAEMTLKFVKPARIDDALVVRTTYDTAKGVRLMISQTIERDGEVLCRAEVTAACIHLDGRPRKPTPALVAAVRPWLAPVGEAG